MISNVNQYLTVKGRTVSDAGRLFEASQQSKVLVYST